VADVYVSTQATYGTVTYNPVTGLFTYTPAPGAGSNGNLTDSFEYTIVDGDGDMSTATVNVTLQPDSEPQGGQASAAVDDDGLTGGNPASTDGDLDANAGDDPLDTSEASFTGNLVVSVGNDTPASVSFAAGVDGSTASVGTETVTYSVVGSVLTATVTGGDRDGTDLFTVTITDAATGAYQVVLLDNVLHASGNAENNASASIGFTISDSEGDTAPTTLLIDFDDDAPTAVADTDSVTEGGSTSGNVLTGNADAFGADGADSGGGVVGVRADGSPANTTTAVLTGTGVAIAGDYGTLTLNADGSYTYQSTAGAVTGDEQDVFVYTIRDADGDLSTTTLTIDVANVTLEGDDQTKVVNEAALDLVADDRGAAGPSLEDDLAPGTVEGSNPGLDTETVTGQLTVAGDGVTYTLTGGTDAYGQLQLNSDGSYTYTLTSPFTTTPAANDG
ncbi:Ig-like domain-containing protein, partial [Aurantiacibacter odishensis]|uniref:Ig-like domain-containing protein n=1 Tax=Aurantiacibacter odishensis TaxID=1155476 RepID=UPI00196ADCE0